MTPEQVADLALKAARYRRERDEALARITRVEALRDGFRNHAWPAVTIELIMTGVVNDITQALDGGAEAGT